MTNLSIKDLFSVAGKTVLVTGGSRGIGEMIAAGFLANGAKVYVSSRKAAVCDATAARLAQESGGTCISIPADLATAEGVASLAAAIGDQEDHLDVLVNNAGASWGAPLDEFPEHGWDKVMDINVKGVFFLTQRLLPLLEAAASAGAPARVINIGSIDGIRTPIFDTFSYGPSKAAVHALTRQLAIPLARRGILVNAVAPGPFPTWMLSTGVGGGGKVETTNWEPVAERNPTGRIGTPADIAGTVLFLASKAGEFIVGQVIACDGGITAT
jgi:NAD(P)-dependent dehydrogenase (short-subunit alcohol dehydrogenase family)